MLDKLTPKQEAKLPEYKERFRKIGMSTERIDRKKAKKAIELLYKCTGENKPKIYFVESPRQALLLYGNLEFFKEETIKYTKADFTQDQINDINSQSNNFCYGNHSAGWKGFYSFFMNETDIPGLEKFKGLEAVCFECNWYLPYEGVAIVVDRPIRLSLDNRNRLHNTKEKAFEYSDGFGWNFINNIMINDELWNIIQTGKLTPEIIDNEGNIELRRTLLELYGVDKYLKEGDYEVLHTDIDSHGKPRRLLRKDNKQDEPILRLEVVNSTPEPDGTFNIYYLPVHPELRPMIGTGKMNEQNQEIMKFGSPQTMTCHNAVASTFGKRGEEYGLPGQIRQGDVFIEYITENDTPFSES